MKKKWKKGLALWVAVLALLTLLPAASAGAESYTTEEYFTFDAASGTITGYNTAGGNAVSIPPTIGGVAVSAIGANAFLQLDTITSVVVPDGVTSIGDHAFDSCQSLSSVTLPDGLTSIGNWAFFVCDHLLSITLPDTLTSIGTGAFSGCNLRSIEIPAGVTVIEDYTFQGCEFLGNAGSSGKVTFLGSITHIGEEAFRGCSLNSGIELPDSLTSIGNRAFFNTLLTGIAIPGSVTAIGDAAFASCYSLESITLPDGLAGIGDGLFSYCTGLRSITLPDSVTSIGNNAFYGCTGLTGITLPENVVSIGECAFSGSGSLSSLTIPAGVTSIGGGAFYNCSGLTGVYFQGDAPAVGSYYYGVFEGTPSDCKVYYPYGASGWTNPWHGRETIARCTVTYDSRGGSAVASATVNAGDLLTQPAAPTKGGAPFVGWYKESSLQTPWNFGSDAITGNITLYAKWNTAPNRKAGIPATTTASVTANTAYTLNLATIFEDADAEPLTYKVSVNGAADIGANASYSYTPVSVGNTTLAFKANDGTADSTDTHTVTLTAVANDFSVTGGVAGTDYTYEGGVLTFIRPGTYQVSMKSGVTSTATNRIVVNALGSSADNPVRITLSDVDIQLSSGCAFEIASESHVQLTLSGDNRLSSTADYAGLQVVADNNLTIDGSGMLLAEGGSKGAGIGGGNNRDGGTVTILSGMVTARGGSSGAGIGGGFNGNGGTFVISGGEVTASSSFGGAGIGGGGVSGGGSGGNGGSVTISGGRVNAQGGDYAAGIGGGFNGSDGGTIVITGGRVIATGSYDGAGIGGGYNGGGGTINISGGEIDAGGGSEGGAGVGGGNKGNGGSITISGGKLTAVSSGYGAGIGGGSGGSGGTIVISGTAEIVARGDDYGSGYGQGAGIGGGNQGNGGTLTISSGTVLAVGGNYAAGIGGGCGDSSGGNGGTVIISGGTVTATGGENGAGIGGGSNGDGAAVTITGGNVAATMGAGGSWNIGAGFNGSSVGTLQNGSGEDVFETFVTLRLAGSDEGYGEQISSIKIDSADYGTNSMYANTSGQVVLYLTGGSEHAIEVSTVNKNYEGMLKDPLDDIYNTLIPKIETSGTYSVADYYVRGATLSVEPGLIVTLTDDGTDREYYRIVCGEGTHLTLDNVAVNNDKDVYGNPLLDESGNRLRNICPLSFTGTGNTLTLTGTNTLKASQYAPSIHAAGGTALTIEGTGGTIEAWGGYFCAGIGGAEGENGGDITINGGTVNVTGGHTGAGIGGGTGDGTPGGNGGNVTVTGGTVTAEGGGNGAGIGGGYEGSNGLVVISGGMVRAYGGGSAAGIGGGIRVNSGGSGGTVNISGGTVTAEGGYYAAGIGGGAQGDGGTVTITGGTVFAKGVGGATDIGPGQGYGGSNSGTLILSGSAAVFLKNDSCVTPTTATHTHQSITGHDGGSIYGIPVAWLDDFGAYLRIYTLSYDLNGGVGTAADPVTQMYNTTAIVSDGSGLSKDYYTFAGWNTIADGSGTAYAAGSSFTFIENTPLYAQWTAESFTITYDLDGGTVSPANPASYTVESDAFTLNNPTKPHYTFTGWSGTGITGTSTNVTIPKGSTGNRSYTAHWAPGNVLPTRKAGIPATLEQSVTVGTPFSLNLVSIFEDSDGDMLIYKVSVNGADYVAADANYSYTPVSVGDTTLVFKANDGMADSTETYTVTLTANAAPAVDSATISPTTVFFDPDDPIDIFTTITWRDAETVTGVVYGSDTMEPSRDYTVAGNKLTITEGFLSGLNLTDGDTVELEIFFDVGDSATLTVEAKQGYVPGTNTAPVRKAGIPATATTSVTVNTAYTLNLAAIFEDADSDTLTYKVSVSGADETGADETGANANYTYTPVSAGTTTLVFKANDGTADSADTYTVTLTANEAPPVTLQSIAITTPANKLVYTVGESLDISGMVITGTYCDGSKKQENITAANVSGFDSSKPATGQILTVTVGGKTTTYAVSIKAAANNNDNDNDKGSGGGGGSSTTTNSTPAAPTQAGTPKIETTVSGNTSIATMTTAATIDSSGKATAAVTQAQIGDAVSKAVEEAQKQGNGMAAVIEIKVEAPATAKTVETSLPKAAMGIAAGSNIAALTISTPIAAITFDAEALDTISGQAAADVKISAAKADVETLSEEAKQLVGDRPVYNFSVTSGDRTISQFGGSVSVSIPYIPKAGEDTNAIVIYYINAEGKAEIVSNCAYDPSTGTISFTTNHFSKYAVGYNKVNFKDVPAAAWYSKAVSFIAARDITTGTGSGNFNPDAKLIRGEFMVMLMRAYGMAPDASPKDNFADAGNTYYTGYLAAAKRLGLTSGVGSNLYAPDKEITRQEMFTLLYNALKETGKLPRGNSGKQLSSFSDAGQVASWAKDAMKLMAETGIIGGSSGKLAPASTTTRAEMAQALYNLLAK